MKPMNWTHLFFPLNPPLADRVRAMVAILRPRTKRSDFDGCPHFRLDGQTGHHPDQMEWVEFVPEETP